MRTLNVCFYGGHTGFTDYVSKLSQIIRILSLKEHIILEAGIQSSDKDTA